MPSKYDHYTTHHTSRRADGWDYTQPAAYFVTICTANRRCLFGTVRRGRMYLNALGRITADEWQQSDAIRDRVHLDAFVVMPNHLHGIVVFADPDAEAPTCPRNYRVFGGESGSDSNAGENDSGDESDSTKASTGGSTLSGESGRRENPEAEGSANDGRPTGPAPKSLGAFVAGFKSAATKRINDHRGTPGAPVWQRNYHDRILRAERHWRTARAYIRRNPAEWGGCGGGNRELKA